MKKLVLSVVVALTFSFQLFAQTPLFEWVETQPVGWNLSPSYTQHLVTVDGMNRSLTARFLYNVVNYDVLYGTYAIEAREGNNDLDLSYPLTGRVHVKSIAGDADGNIYVGGSYMKTMLLGVDDSLVNVGNVADSFNINGFLLKINANGFLVWKRNMELTHPELETVQDIRIDPMGSAWYSWSEWDSAHIVKLDATGNDVGMPVNIYNTRGISSFDFAPQGDVYFAGASDNGTVQFASQSYTAPHSYNMYIAHFDPMQPANNWVKFGNDFTFQFPKVVADPFGDAFVGANVNDTLSWGNVHFHDHQWGADFFVVKVNPQGNFIWGQQAPLMDSLSGDIQPASDKFIDVDTAGNVYMLADQRGVFNWGNGIESGNDGEPLSNSKILLMKFKGTNGDPLFAQTFAVGSTNAHAIAVDQHKNIYFTQTISDTTDYGFLHFEIPQYQNTFVLAKLTYLQDTTLNVSVNDLTTNTFNVYPNPATTSIVVPQELQGSDVSVLDVTGKEVAYHQGVGSTINVEALPSGCYFLEFRSSRIRFIGKVVKE